MESIQKKRVTIVVPCRNEYKFIGKLLESIYESDYDSSLLEVIIVDGMSDDGTRKLIVNKYIPRYDILNISIVDNEKKKTPYAFNLGIKKSLGNIIIILGARHVISENYISEVVKVLSTKKDIGCVGGVVNNTFENETSKIISRAMASKFGIGFSNFRSIKNDAYVDTIGSPAFRKEIFEEIGFFDERLTRNQDDDFSFRLIKAGYKIFLKSNISIKYYVRASFKKLFKQYKQYGYWKVFVNKKHKTVTTLRQLFPLFFLLSILLLLILGLFSIKFIYLLCIELFIYLLLNFLFAFKDNRFKLKSLIKQMYACLILHISYGLGYLEGVIDFIILNKKPNIKNEELSR